MTDELNDKAKAVLAVVDAHGQARLSVKDGTSLDAATVNPASARRLIRDGVLVEFRDGQGYAMVRRS